MSRKEFMEQLEKLLMDIPQEERVEALTYYHGYFEDAGKENEESIIRELESPEAVAAIIKADISCEDTKEYTESGYTDTRFDKKEAVGSYQPHEQNNNSGAKGYNYDDGSRNSSYNYNAGASGDNTNGTWAGSANGGDDKTLKIVLIVIAAVFTSPIWLGILTAALGLILGVVGTVLGLVLALILTVVAFYVTAFVLAGVGISALASGGVAAGLGLMGAGLVLLAIAIAGTVGCVWLCGRTVPWMFKGIIALCKKPFQGRRKTI